jgi:hypothetical protein
VRMAVRRLRPTGDGRDAVVSARSRLSSLDRLVLVFALSTKPLGLIRTEELVELVGAIAVEAAIRRLERAKLVARPFAARAVHNPLLEARRRSRRGTHRLEAVVYTRTREGLGLATELIDDRRLSYARALEAIARDTGPRHSS